MGQLHAEAIASVEGATLAVVVDPEPAARAVADRHGARWARELDDVLLDPEAVDGFIVALPDRHHVDTAVAVLEVGGRMLLEKPLADTLAGAQRIARAERAGGGRLLAGHILRHDPRYAAAA
jgi:predicted dehydrogenase